MEATEELHQIIPPRLEDAGLEDCALPPDAIKAAFLKAAAAVKSRAAGIFTFDDEGCVADPWPEAADRSDVVDGGLTEADDHPGACVAVKGLGDGGDDAVVVGGGEEADTGHDVVVGSEEERREKDCVDGLQGLEIGEKEKKKKKKNGEEEDEDEERPILVGGMERGGSGLRRGALHPQPVAPLTGHWGQREKSKQVVTSTKSPETEGRPPGSSSGLATDAPLTFLATSGDRIVEGADAAAPAPFPVHGTLRDPAIFSSREPSHCEFVPTTSGQVKTDPSAFLTSAAFASYFFGEHASDVRIRELDSVTRRVRETEECLRGLVNRAEQESRELRSQIEIAWKEANRARHHSHDAQDEHQRALDTLCRASDYFSVMWTITELQKRSESFESTSRRQISEMLSALAAKEAEIARLRDSRELRATNDLVTHWQGFTRSFLDFLQFDTERRLSYNYIDDPSIPPVVRATLHSYLRHSPEAAPFCVGGLSHPVPQSLFDENFLGGTRGDVCMNVDSVAGRTKLAAHARAVAMEVTRRAQVAVEARRAQLAAEARAVQSGWRRPAGGAGEDRDPAGGEAGPSGRGGEGGATGHKSNGPLQTAVTAMARRDPTGFLDR